MREGGREGGKDESTTRRRGRAGFLRWGSKGHKKGICHLQEIRDYLRRRRDGRLWDAETGGIIAYAVGVRGASSNSSSSGTYTRPSSISCRVADK